jgi:hypothetical protein
MNIQRASHLARRNLLFTQIASIALVTLGSLVLIGWQLQIEGLKSILPGLFSIDPNSAAGILLRGAALSLLLPQEAKKAFHLLASAPAMVVTALGLLMQREYFLGERWEPEVYGISRKISFQERV